MANKTRKWAYAAAILMVVLVAGYFVAQSLVKRKISDLVGSLPPAIRVTYASIEPHLLNSSLSINGLRIELMAGGGRPAQGNILPEASMLAIGELHFGGIHFLQYLFSHKLHIGLISVADYTGELRSGMKEKDLPAPTGKAPFMALLVDKILLTGGAIKGFEPHRGGLPAKDGFAGKEGFSIEAEGELDSVYWTNAAPMRLGGFQFRAKKIGYDIPGARQHLQIKNLFVNSKDGSLHIDTIRIAPDIDKLELGRTKGLQVDVVNATTEGLSIEGLDFKALTAKQFIAAKISVRHNAIHIFRDRRLPRDESLKPMPMEFLKNLPLSIRVGAVHIGSSAFTYEEFPGKGNKPGTLKILRLSGSLSPLINHPRDGDPIYSTLKLEGSLMGSGSVTTVARIPLRKDVAYEVEGAFHQLDVTSLNDAAENLGRIHLESGMLNTLSFQFNMTPEKATGHIIGEYHDLVVDKLREKGDDPKTDKVKTFFLHKFIIPRNKDRKMPESKRTGKVDYKRDPTRNFSFYMLHALLVGVKSSFSLGFLLPG